MHDVVDYLVFTKPNTNISLLSREEEQRVGIAGLYSLYVDRKIGVWLALSQESLRLTCLNASSFTGALVWARSKLTSTHTTQLESTYRIHSMINDLAEFVIRLYAQRLADYVWGANATEAADKKFRKCDDAEQSNWMRRRTWKSNPSSDGFLAFM